MNEPGSGEDPRANANAAAQAARSWARQRGCLFWGVVIVLGLVALGQCAPDGPDKAPAADAPAAPAISATAEEIFAAYDANEVAAQQRFGGGPLEVTGRIEAITLDLTDDPVVRLAGGNAFEYVSASLDESAKAAAGTLRKGQKITLRCSSVSEVIGTPMLRDCRPVG